MLIKLAPMLFKFRDRSLDVKVDLDKNRTALASMSVSSHNTSSCCQDITMLDKF